MTCPFCNQVMKDGFLQAAKIIVWDPQKLGGCVQPYNEDSFPLANNFWGNCAVKSYYCDHCRVIITFREEEQK